MHFKEKFLITSGVSQYDRFFGRFCQHKRIIAVYDHHVLYPDASQVRNIYSWLHRNDHPVFQYHVAPEREGRVFVYLKTDPVAEAMSEIVVVACFLYEIPCCLVGFFCKNAAFDSLQPFPVRFKDYPVYLFKLLIGFSDKYILVISSNILYILPVIQVTTSRAPASSDATPGVWTPVSDATMVSATAFGAKTFHVMLDLIRNVEFRGPGLYETKDMCKNFIRDIDCFPDQTDLRLVLDTAKPLYHASQRNESIRFQLLRVLHVQLVGQMAVLERQPLYPFTFEKLVYFPELIRHIAYYLIIRRLHRRLFHVPEVGQHDSPFTAYKKYGRSTGKTG